MWRCFCFCLFVPLCLFERCALIRRYFRLFEKCVCVCFKSESDESEPSDDALVCLFKNCIRLFEKCTFEYKVGEWVI